MLVVLRSEPSILFVLTLARGHRSIVMRKKQKRKRMLQRKKDTEQQQSSLERKKVRMKRRVNQEGEAQMMQKA